MRDGAENVIYVGKARNLRKRLTSYRVANPDRLSRRHLRLLGSVARVELQLCADEAAALRREAELILSLKPRFNRAGTWAPPPHYLTWRVECCQVFIGLVENAEKEDRVYGPLRGSGRWVKAALVRLLWLALNPSSDLSQMPAGWCHARFPEPAVLVCNESGDGVKSVLDELIRGNIEEFCSWVRARRAAGFTRVFDEGAFEADLETLQRAWTKRG